VIGEERQRKRRNMEKVLNGGKIEVLQQEKGNLYQYGGKRVLSQLSWPISAGQVDPSLPGHG
jgi:hypothetical protein